MNIPLPKIFFVLVTIKDKKWSVVKGLSISDFSKKKMEATGKELMEERDEALAICKE